jgi:hypothetical protein
MTNPDQVTQWLRYIYLRIEAGDPAPVIAAAREKWNARTTDFPFEYQFLDDQLDMDSTKRKVDLRTSWGHLLPARRVHRLPRPLRPGQLDSREAHARDRHPQGDGRRYDCASPGWSRAISFCWCSWVPYWPCRSRGSAWAAGWRISPSARTSNRSSSSVRALVVLLIATFTVSFRAIRAAQTDPVKALRHE